MSMIVPVSRRQFVAGAGALAASSIVPKSLLAASGAATQRVVIHADSEIGLVRPEFHGHFVEHLGSCVYGGLWVGKDSRIPNISGYRKQAVEYLKELGVPVLRWPGGCFADDYHWREGIGPAANRPKRVNIHWGNYIEDGTFSNTLGLRYGKLIQNIFTVTKTGAVLGLIVLGISLGRNPAAMHANFAHPFQPQRVSSLGTALNWTNALALLVAICLSQTGSLFSADSWHNIAFAAGEVRRPERNVTRAMVIGTIAVITLYILANIAYLVTLPLDAIQHAPADRVGTATLRAIFPGAGNAVMAVAIMISTFGTINALTLTGARVYYAMARQRLFFPFAGKLNRATVPASSLRLQGLWAAMLVLPRVFDPRAQSWGNLYSNLLEYVISAALIFYILTVAGVFRLRIKRPEVPRPHRTLGYPVIPLLYILAASAILLVLLAYRPVTTWPGLLIVLLGVPIYWTIQRSGRNANTAESERRRADGSLPSGQL